MSMFVIKHWTEDRNQLCVGEKVGSNWTLLVLVSFYFWFKSLHRSYYQRGAGANACAVQSRRNPSSSCTWNMRSRKTWGSSLISANELYIFGQCDRHFSQCIKSTSVTFLFFTEQHGVSSGWCGFHDATNLLLLQYVSSWKLPRINRRRVQMH